MALAEYLLNTSHNVVVTARSKAPLDKLKARFPNQVDIVVGDASDFSLAQKAVDTAFKNFGSLDGLVVNHGILEPVGKLRDADVEQWQKLFDVNFISAVAYVGLT